MFILHGGQVTGPFDPNDVAAKAVGRSLPADAMMGPTPQGPWMPVYAVASERTGQIGTLPGLAIIAVASVAFTAFLLWMSGSSPKPKPAEPLPAAPAVTAVTAAPVPTSDGRGGIRRAVCPMKAFPCSVGGPDSTAMTIENGVGCPMTATMFVKDGRESLNQMGFLVVRCPTGQEWRAPTFSRVP